VTESSPSNAAAVPAAAAAALPAAAPLRWVVAGVVLLAVLATAALVYAWNTQQRVKSLEAELVKRQRDSADQAAEARLLSRQAQDIARESAAKLSLLEARVAETSIQRTQLDELIQSLARSRDENVLADLEAAVRVALQQSAITGSAEPLLATLRQADERLARYNQPRLERVRRAVNQDLDRVRGAGAADPTVLAMRIDDVIRQVDELPLLAAAERHGTPPAGAPRAGAAAAAPRAAASAAPGSAAQERWRAFGERLWSEVRSLVRVTRIDNPEAALLAPEQSFFVRENLKLRLLNARLALLSRQFDTAQSDLREALGVIERYFDRGSRRGQVAAETLRQVSVQAKAVTVPRADATLAAIATTSAGR
jgi:uroporphyrin-3 C-methyltransferase